MIRAFMFGISLMVLFDSSPMIAQTTSEEDGLGLSKPSPGISQGELKTLLASKFLKSLSVPRVRASSDEQLKRLAENAKTAHKTAPVSRGDPTKTYDVIIQLGHYPRKTGKTGGQGKLVSEQEMVALVGVGIVQKLANLQNGKKPISVLLVGADDYENHLSSSVFLALHTDATDTKCAVGPSVGYQKIGDATGMHAIALALAITLNKDASKFMNDNYTRDEAGYYAFRQFNTKGFKGLLEMSELTCEEQEKALLEKASLLSTNLAYAIQFALRQ